MRTRNEQLCRERQTSVRRAMSRLHASIVAVAVIAALSPGNAAADDDPTKLAVAYLVQEVPAWQPANNCFSCHNNGDGARALLVASSAGFDVPDESLAASREWLAQPER